MNLSLFSVSYGLSLVQQILSVNGQNIFKLQDCPQHAKNTCYNCQRHQNYLVTSLQHYVIHDKLNIYLQTTQVETEKNKKVTANTFSYVDLQENDKRW